MKKSRKNTKGITLVALVITIVILLILAGITIATLGGENGLFTRAKQAKEKYNIEKDIEEFRFKLMENEIDSIITSKKEDSIEKIFEDIEGVEIIKEEDGTYTIIKDGNIYIKDNNNNIFFKGNVGKIKPKIDEISRNTEDTTNPLEEIIYTIEVSTEDEQGLSSVKIKKEYQMGETSKFYTYREKSVKGNTATLEISIKSRGKYKIYVYGKNGLYTESKEIEINNIYEKPSSPIISVTSGEKLENDWFISEVGIKIEAMEKNNTRTVYTITGQDGEIEVENGLKEFLINEDGIYEIIAYTITEEGIYSEEAILTIKIDTTAPEVFKPIDGKGDGTGTQIEIEAKAEDISGIKEYQYYLGGEHIKNTEEETYIITNLEPFIEYEMYVIAVDNTGKQTQSETLKFYTGRYLFNNGEEFEELTGGWQGSYYCDYNKLSASQDYYGNGFFNKNNNKLNFGNNADTHGDGGFYTKNTIDCTKYNALYLTGTYTSYWHDNGYSNSGTGFAILFGNKVALSTVERISRSNSVFNNKLLLDLINRDVLAGGTWKPICSKIDDYNAQIIIMSATSWSPTYKWYASISQIYILR